MNQTFMKEEPVLPMVLSMLTNSLYNIIDSYFVAKISEDSMTALSFDLSAALYQRYVVWKLLRTDNAA